MPVDPQNDWTLDTNVLIRANQAPNPARALMECIGSKAVLCWDSSVAQEYQARGAIHLRIGAPPVIASGKVQLSWVDLWISRMGALNHIHCLRPERLSGAEQDHLASGGVRDRGDYPFIELARASDSKRLVSQEEDYASSAVRVIFRVTGVRCMDYASANEACNP